MIRSSAILGNGQPSWWGAVLFGAMAGGLGWGIRGQYGHETGAMIAGLLVGLVAVVLFRPGASSLDGARAVAWCAVAMGFGGSMTYGQTIGLTQDAPLVGNWAALRWGMIGLALKGGIWVGFAAAFLGMGLSGTRYRPRELLGVMLGLLGLFFLGVWLVNTPFDPSNKVLPALYFSDDWHWEPGAELKPRREVWGGLLLALVVLIVYLWWYRRDRLARNLAFWGILGGAIGFPLGQALQAFHAWNPALFREGLWGHLDPVLNWWNLMETTFGATFGAVLGLGLWLNRARIGPPAEPAHVSLQPRIEWGLCVLHLTLLITSEFLAAPGIEAYTEFSLLLGLIPIIAVTEGRWWPYLVVLPITLAPIAGKTLRQLCYQEHTMGALTGWWILIALPVGLAAAAAVWFAQPSRVKQRTDTFAQPALVLVTWLYFGLNFAFYHFPWPWQPWTGRTPNGLIFSLCALGLTYCAFRHRPVTTHI